MDTVEHTPRRALVVGLGITGIAAAISLQRAGWTPVVVEKAPGRRRGGYFIGLLGAGRASAERLGLMAHLHNRTPSPRVNVELDRAGGRTPTPGFGDMPGAPWLMLRGDVEKAAFEVLPREVEVRYATVPTAIEQDDHGVDVTLRTTSADGATSDATERFDLVVGADGLRSTVRRMVFGPDETYLTRLDYMIAAFELPGDLPGLARGEGGILAEPGRSFWVFPFADHAPTALFSYRTDDVDAEFGATPAERIRDVFGPEPLGATMEAAVAAMEQAGSVLFDSVEQVHLDSWHRGRVVLVGDAAWCVTLYAGMGVSSGLAGGELLGTLLARHPDDLETALTRWESRMRPYIHAYQQLGVRNRAFFTPADRAETWRRTLLMRLLRTPVGARLARLMTGGEAMRMRDADIAAA